MGVLPKFNQPIKDFVYVAYGKLFPDFESKRTWHDTVPQESKSTKKMKLKPMNQNRGASTLRYREEYKSYSLCIASMPSVYNGPSILLLLGDFFLLLFLPLLVSSDCVQSSPDPHAYSRVELIGPVICSLFQIAPELLEHFGSVVFGFLPDPYRSLIVCRRHCPKLAFPGTTLVVGGRLPM